MKTIRSIVTKLLVVTFMLSFASCQKWDIFGMQGKGSLISEDIDFALVEGIILNIPADVYLTQGNEQSIRIEAQENILDNIIYSDQQGILKMSFDDNVTRCETIKVYMTIQNLRKIEIKGAGSIISDSDFTCNGNLEILIGGVGKVDLSANAQDVNLDISGAGKVDLETTCENLKANISGSADIYLLNGAAKTADFNTSGSGKISAYDLNIETCSIKVTGSGNNYVNVSESLTVKITGCGNTYYIGNPTLSVNVTGLGRVINDNK